MKEHVYICRLPFLYKEDYLILRKVTKVSMPEYPIPLDIWIVSGYPIPLY